MMTIYLIRHSITEGNRWKRYIGRTECQGILRFHAYIRRMLEKGQDVDDLAEKLMRRNPGAVVVTDEIGYGIVPADAFLREYREAAGRVCTKLAANAKEVWRVSCGIGTRIKG